MLTDEFVNSMTRLFDVLLQSRLLISKIYLDSGAEIKEPYFEFETINGTARFFVNAPEIICTFSNVVRDYSYKIVDALLSENRVCEAARTVHSDETENKWEITNTAISYLEDSVIQLEKVLSELIGHDVGQEAETPEPRITCFKQFSESFVPMIDECAERIFQSFSTIECMLTNDGEETIMTRDAVATDKSKKIKYVNKKKKSKKDKFDSTKVTKSLEARNP
jgi:hypothetical protein